MATRQQKQDLIDTITGSVIQVYDVVAYDSKDDDDIDAIISTHRLKYTQTTNPEDGYYVWEGVEIPKRLLHLFKPYELLLP